MWESTELRGCLERFVSKTKDKNRHVLLIDGLDEFDDDFQQDLVALLKKIQDCYSTKICVASRDWNLFRDAFHQGPSLRMDVLTRRDIDIYVEKRLETSQAFLELQKLHSENIRALLAEIRAKANGVFLWVVLVVEQLLLTAQDDPRLETIRKVLNVLPPDLERLYNQIQTSLTPEQKSTASKIYQLVMGWKRLWGVKMEATLLWLTLNLNERYDEFDVTSLMRRLLATYTKGIVQVGSSSRAVDFIHRTAFDWLRMESNWARICSQQPEEFVSSLDIVSVLVKHLRHVWNRFGNFVEVDKERIALVFRIFRFAGDIPNTSRNRLRLLSILEQMETYQLLPLNKFSPDQSLSVSDDMLRPHLAVYAAAWNCLPCLQAICESDPSTIHAKCFFVPFDPQGWPLEALSLLEVAIFGGPATMSENSAMLYSKFVGFHLTPWRASQRLDVVEYLLSLNAFPSDWLITRIQDLKKRDGYFTLLSTVFNDPTKVKSFEALKQEFLPGIEASRLEDQFSSQEDTCIGFLGREIYNSFQEAN